MKSKDYKRLDIDLARQKVVNDQPWAMAGFAIFIAVLLLIIFCYKQYI